MSGENDNTQAQGEESSEQLADALGGSETSFVVGGDEKKAVTNPVIYLALVAVLGGAGLWYMYKRQGPSSAEAAATPEAAKAEETINTFLTSGPSGIKVMQEMMRNTEKVVQQFLDYPSVTQVPLSELHTNPFRSSTPAENVAAGADATKKKREEEKLAAIKASEALQLQSIIHSGSRKACMINNALYSEGQQIEQFTIEKIEPARVIVKAGVYRFALKMQR
jgi:hypothetical protein